MNLIINDILPLIMIFGLGFFLRCTGFLKTVNGDFFLRLIFYVALPALLLPSVAGMELSPDLALLPLFSAIIIILSLALSYYISRFFNFAPKSRAVFIIAAMIINNGFTLPFVLAAFGPQGVGRLVFFDLSNGFLALTVSYYIACYYGDGDFNLKKTLRKVILSPPLLALLAGLFLNIAGLHLPKPALNFMDMLGKLVVPLTMLTLGVFLDIRRVNYKAVFSVIGIRMAFSFLLAIGLLYLIPLDNTSGKVVLLYAASPVGYNTLTFASLEGLDKKFAGNIVSVSILIGLVTTTLLLCFLL